MPISAEEVADAIASAADSGEISLGKPVTSPGAAAGHAEQESKGSAAAAHGNQIASSDDDSSEQDDSSLRSEDPVEKLASDDPVAEAAVVKQKAAHREEKRDMKDSAKHTKRVQHIASEESPDPRANRERLLRQLSEEIRSLPTLPAADGNPDMHCDGYNEAVQLPPKHCAFKGCACVFNQESELRKHLYDSHYQNGSAVLKELVDSIATPDHVQFEVQSIVSSFVGEAIATQIRQGPPFACNSIDRRAMAAFSSTLSDATTEALVCVSCACVFPRVDTQRRHRIGWAPAMVKDKFLGYLSAEETKDIYGHEQYLSRYGSLENGPNLIASPFKESLQSWSLKVPFQKGGVQILCCPEDRKCEVCSPDCETLCDQCEVPLCKRCEQSLQHDPPRHPEGALTNDMWTGFAAQMIYDEKVTVVEMICASVCIVSLICFSMKSNMVAFCKGKRTWPAIALAPEATRLSFLCLCRSCFLNSRSVMTPRRRGGPRCCQDLGLSSPTLSR